MSFSEQSDEGDIEDAKPWLPLGWDVWENWGFMKHFDWCIIRKGYKTFGRLYSVQAQKGAFEIDYAQRLSTVTRLMELSLMIQAQILL